MGALLMFILVTLIAIGSAIFDIIHRRKEEKNRVEPPSSEKQDA